MFIKIRKINNFRQSTLPRKLLISLFTICNLSLSHAVLAQTTTTSTTSTTSTLSATGPNGETACNPTTATTPCCGNGQLNYLDPKGTGVYNPADPTQTLEACDLGSNNGATGAGCTSTCTIVTGANWACSTNLSSYQTMLGTMNTLFGNIQAFNGNKNYTSPYTTGTVTSASGCTATSTDANCTAYMNDLFVYKSFNAGTLQCHWVETPGPPSTTIQDPAAGGTYTVKFAATMSC